MISHMLYSNQQEGVIQKAVVEEKKVFGVTQAHILPGLGFFAMFVLAAGIGASIHKRMGRADLRGSRQFEVLLQNEAIEVDGYLGILPADEEFGDEEG